MMNILNEYAIEITSGGEVNSDQLMLRLFKPLSIQVTEALVEKCLGELEKDDDVLEILEYILRYLFFLLNY